MRPHGLSLIAWIASLCSLTAPSGASTQVRPGIEVLVTDSVRLIAGKRLALLTNQTGIDRSGHRDIDLLRAVPGARLVLILSPEHGIKGTEDRPGLRDGTDSASGLPIYSLYGGTPLAAIAALDSVDVILIDLQDIGARYYSYPPTAVLLLQEGKRRGKAVVVLDRPDPVGGDAVQGNVAMGGVITRVEGHLPIPMRHGMTLGELVRFANEELNIHARLTVVPAAGWSRAMYYDDTALPWMRPSLNMPDLESALHYPGTCLFEGTNLSVGRGTPFAFQVVGAPWLDTAAVLRAWRARFQGAGVEAMGDTVTPRFPTDGKFDGVRLSVIRLRVTDRSAYDPTRAAVALLAAVRATHPKAFSFAAGRFDQLAGGPALRNDLLRGEQLAGIFKEWDGALARFRATRLKYLLY